MESIDLDSCAGDLPVWPDTASEDEGYIEQHHRFAPLAWSRGSPSESGSMGFIGGLGQHDSQKPLHLDSPQPEAITSESASATTCMDTESTHSEVEAWETTAEDAFIGGDTPGVAVSGGKVEATLRKRRSRAHGCSFGVGGLASRRILQEGVTTLVVRNLPKTVSQIELVRELDRSGFAGKYDYCYAPVQSFHTRKHVGFAFVNFLSAKLAQHFACQWHCTHRFNLPEHAPMLNVSAAAVQGREANLARAGSARICHIKNSKYRPLVVTIPSAEPAALDGCTEEGGDRTAGTVQRAQVAPPRAAEVPRRDVQPQSQGPPRSVATACAALAPKPPVVLQLAAALRGGIEPDSGKSSPAAAAAVVAEPATADQADEVSVPVPAFHPPSDAPSPCVASAGSLGHPFHCARRCKFAGKPRGCKDGASCDHCHLCTSARMHRRQRS